MTTRPLNRRTGTALAAAGGVLCVLAVVAPPAGATEGKLFTGGGRGLTAELAVQSAIEDAETSAAAEQLYTCDLVGEPVVFPSPGIFRAEATVSCIP